MDKNKIFAIFGIISITALFFSHRNYKKRIEDHKNGIFDHESCTTCENQIEAWKKLSKYLNLKEDYTEKILDKSFKSMIKVYGSLIEKYEHETYLNNQIKK